MSVRIDPRELQEARSMLLYLIEGAGKAMVRAINRSLDGTRSDMTKAIYDRYAVKQKKIRETFRIKRASKSSVQGSATTEGLPLNLVEYGARQTKTGVSVQVLRNSRRKLVAHAYIATMKSGKKLAMRRAYEGPRSKVKPGLIYAMLPKQYRYPAVPVYGPRMQDHLAKPEILSVVKSKAAERYVKNFDHEASYLIRQKLESGDG